MDLRHLRYFLGVAECGSFSRAADELRIAQPTLSRQIAGLEGEIGALLFVRSSSGVELTEAGTVFLEHAQSIVQRSELAILEAQLRAKTVSGLASIGAHHALSEIVFAEVAELYAKKYPDVTLRFAVGLTYLLLEWLDADRIDLAVVTNVALGQRYHSKLLFSESVYAIAPVGHPISRQANGTCNLADLASHPLIVSTPINQARRKLEDKAKQQNLKLSVAAECEDPKTMKSMVARGLGIGILPYTSVNQEMASGSYWGSRIEGLQHDRYLVRKRNAPPRRAVSELARFLVAAIRRHFRLHSSPNIKMN